MNDGHKSANTQNNRTQRKKERRWENYLKTYGK